MLFRMLQNQAEHTHKAEVVFELNLQPGDKNPKELRVHFRFLQSQLICKVVLCTHHYTFNTDSLVCNCVRNCVCVGDVWLVLSRLQSTNMWFLRRNFPETKNSCAQWCCGVVNNPAEPLPCTFDCFSCSNKSLFTQEGPFFKTHFGSRLPEQW